MLCDCGRDVERMKVCGGRTYCLDCAIAALEELRCDTEKLEKRAEAKGRLEALNDMWDLLPPKVVNDYSNSVWVDVFCTMRRQAARTYGGEKP